MSLSSVLPKLPEVVPIFKDIGDGSVDFVGDFDAKYEAEIDPWEQSGKTGVRADYYAFARARLVSRLRNRLGPNAKGLEVGCGYGYVASLLARHWQITGMDVSETALKRAAELNPGINYVLGDITNENFVPPVPLETEPGPSLLPPRFHFVILSQIWWYILHEFGLTMRNALACLEHGGFLVIHQAFLKKQRYAMDIAPGFEGAIRLLMANPQLRLVECHYEDSGNLCYYDGLIILRKIEG